MEHLVEERSLCERFELPGPKEITWGERLYAALVIGGPVFCFFTVVHFLVPPVALLYDDIGLVIGSS